jgi:hypothetical protein
MDSDRPQSRRHLLQAAGAGAASIAGLAVLGTSLPVAAADPNDVVLDFPNQGFGTTSIASATTAGPGAAFLGQATATKLGVYGFSGAGNASAPDFLNLQTPFGAGVYGNTSDEQSTGVFGDGVVSATSFSTGVWGRGDVGVFGEGGAGVWGFSALTRGSGVIGEGSATANGVFANVGNGVLPLAPAGVALYARAETTALTALQVVGKAKFSRSGQVTIAKGASSIGVTVTGATTLSFGFAVLAGNASGRFVRAVVATTNKITIYLNTSLILATKVNWIVFN